MSEARTPATSEAMAKMMQTNPAVIRKILAGLRKQGFVTSEKGHGGGWRLARDLEAVTMHDIYSALDHPAFFAVGNRTESPGCLVEKAVNRAMNKSFEEAEALLLARFKQVTLSELREDVRQQRDNNTGSKEQEEEHRNV